MSNILNFLSKPWIQVIALIVYLLNVMRFVFGVAIGSIWSSFLNKKMKLVDVGIMLFVLIIACFIISIVNKNSTIIVPICGMLVSIGMILCIIPILRYHKTMDGNVYGLGVVFSDPLIWFHIAMFLVFFSKYIYVIKNWVDIK